VVAPVNEILVPEGPRVIVELFGKFVASSGGRLVEVFKDSALALPPLNSTLARRMMEQTRIYKALRGGLGRKPVNMAALEKLMVQPRYLVLEQPWIKEIDIHPLVASSERLVALDARVVAHGQEVTEDKPPRLAIRPYPLQYVAPFTMKDGTTANIRPIPPEDEPLMVKFHNTLSEHSVMMRYTQPIALSVSVR
jgi:acetyltransferase